MSSLLEEPGGIFQDWNVNSGNPKSQLVMAGYRLARKLHLAEGPVRWAALPLLAMYSVLIEWVLGIEISYKARIGPRLRLFHGQALVIHERTVIGADCTLRHATTLGMRKDPDEAPVLGDGVDVGSNCVIIGRVVVGTGACIAAGSVVFRDVPPGATFAGNPARRIA